MKINRTASFLIWFPMAMALWLSAVVNLQLFQDGAEYLFDLVQNEKVAVMHQRIGVFLFQVFTVFLTKTLIYFLSNVPRKMDLIRFSFSFSYAFIPLFCFALSWYLVKTEKKQYLLIWPALLILLINLVNFSWVSEILIALQLSFPLLLITIVMPGTRTSWYLLWPLLLIIFNLHPLVVAIFLTCMLGMILFFYKKPRKKKIYKEYALLFLGISLFKLLLLMRRMSSYEKRMIEPHYFNDYFFSTSLENRLFLAIALTLTILCLLTKIIHQMGMNLNHSYRIGIGLAILGPCILVFQYQYAIFQLKTGLSIIAGLTILLMMCVDSCTIDQVRYTKDEHWQKELLVREDKWRLRLITVLSIVFSLVVMLKSLIWQTSVQKLQYTLLDNPGECLELASDEFSWLHHAPYKMINTWAITSLALLQQNQSPRKILLEDGCQLYYETGQVKLHSWKILHKDRLMPQL